MSKQVFCIDLNSKTEYQRLLPGKPQTLGMKSGRVYLDTGKDCGEHSTEEKEDLIYYSMEAKAGITIRTYEIGWENGKIKSIVDKGMR